MNQTLWQQLLQEGLVSGEEPIVENDDNAPWYVRTMLGVAGWFGALFLLGAVFSIVEFVLDSTLATGIMGVVACLASVIIYRTSNRNDFLQQFAFAVSLSGQALLVFSVLSELELFRGENSLVEHLRILSLITVCLQSLLFFAIPNYLHRIWSAVLIIISLMFLMNFYGFYPFTLSIFLAVGLGLWLQEFHWAKLGNKLTTSAYALIFVSLVLLFAQAYLWPQSVYARSAFGVPETLNILSERLFSLSTGVVLLGLVLVLLNRASLSLFSKTGIAAVVLSLVVSLIGVYVPGITVGTALVLMGFAHGNKVLMGMGLVVLVVFIFQFYYQLELTLLVKSGLLVVSGGVLLLIRQIASAVFAKGV